MEHFSNDHKDHPNQHENSHKQHDETGYPNLNLLSLLFIELKPGETETKT